MTLSFEVFLGSIHSYVASKLPIAFARFNSCQFSPHSLAFATPRSRSRSWFLGFLPALAGLSLRDSCRSNSSKPHFLPDQPLASLLPDSAPMLNSRLCPLFLKFREFICTDGEPSRAPSLSGLLRLSTWWLLSSRLFRVEEPPLYCSSC
ncbi:hypothetical protein Nepgr_030274 [Nepenthes gracilis]|uniref:Uncharacterized protein n=1 Tax=Nepenthes gracilis TaxID=150966 RepID=A0AAD3TGE2_NEPGR|nr:hypothetical protein Nepgr_030274 [Nepenthes gracilis]